MCSVETVDFTCGAIARLSTGQARVSEPDQKPNGSEQTVACLPFVARFGPPHLRTNRTSANPLRTHRPPALAATRSLRHLPESVRRLTGGLASPASSSTPEAWWSGGRVTGGSREADWADTKRGHALSLGKKRCAVGSQLLTCRPDQCQDGGLDVLRQRGPCLDDAGQFPTGDDRSPGKPSGKRGFGRRRENAQVLVFSGVWRLGGLVVLPAVNRFVVGSNPTRGASD